MRSLYHILFLVVLSGYCGLAQSFKNKEYKPTYKQFETKDSGMVNQNAVLILFDDNTFINYGAAHSSSDTLWYTAGRWLGNNEMIMCRTYREMPEDDQIVNQIRSIYYPRQKKIAIKLSAKFKKVSYLDYVFSIVKPGTIKDRSRKICYVEMK